MFQLHPSPPPIRYHGLSRHPLYHTWYEMIYRCENSKCKSYGYYGGRGITVCDRWHDVSLFVEDVERLIGPKPARRSLDRIDNDGNYEPGNVRWATFIEQYENRGCRMPQIDISSVSLPEERWLPVPGYAGFYEVSDWGNVASLARSTTQGRLLRVQISPQGYRQVRLSKYGRVTTALVGPMVLSAFVSLRPRGKRARHGSGGKLDDNLANLFWG